MYCVYIPSHLHTDELSLMTQWFITMVKVTLLAGQQSFPITAFKMAQEAYIQ